jgi:aerobic carbon-monoxide dehydrogenase medium subunit
VITSSFRFLTPGSATEALDMLVTEGADSRLLAGGQSLVVALKSGETRCPCLIDLSGAAGLSSVDVTGGELRIGALVRHAELERSALVRAHAPLLAHAASAVADPQVRHQGTIGGSLANRDPAADLPAALCAARAVVELADPGGVRDVGIDTYCRAGHPAPHVVLALRVPRTGPAPWGFQKFRRRAMMWATVGVSYLGGDRPGIGLAGMGETTLRAGAAEAALLAGQGARAVAALAAAGTRPPGDAAASAQYRRHLATVLLARALRGERTH